MRYKTKTKFTNMNNENMNETLIKKKSGNISQI